MAAFVKHVHQHLTHRHHHSHRTTFQQEQEAPAAWDKAAVRSHDASGGKEEGEGEGDGEGEGEAPEAVVGAVLTVGCFDLTHRGHKVLIDRLLAMGDVISVG